MKRSIIHIIPFCWIVLLGCNSSKPERPAPTKFVIETGTLQTDTVIKMAVLINNTIICLKDNGKFLVLDSNFKPIDSIAARLNKLHPTQLYAIHDTPVIVANRKCYAINNNLSTQPFSVPAFIFDFPNFIDTSYYVYNCCVGEFGGSVFFLNRKTNKTYSYPATCVNQVVKFRDNYIICNNLYSTDFISIHDPSKLFELKDDQQKNSCNWYVAVDSLKDYRKLAANTPKGVVRYTDSTKSWHLSTLTTFEYRNELYSIISTDSATLIKKHVGFRLITVDTLRKQETIGHGLTSVTNSGVAMAYGDTWTMGLEPAVTSYVSSGLIVIQGNRIKFLEFITPHSWIEGKSR